MFAKSLSAAAIVHSKNGCIPEGPLVRGVVVALERGWPGSMAPKAPCPSSSDSVILRLSPSKYGVHGAAKSLVNENLPDQRVELGRKDA